MELLFVPAVIFAGLAVYAAFGGFDRPPSKTDELAYCDRCGKPTFALEYHRPRCRGRLGERTFSAVRRRY